MRLKHELKRYAKMRRATWWQSKIGTGEYVETQIQADVRMRLFFDSELCQRIYCGGFEEAERAFLQVFLQPGDIFVDVGANVGLFTLIAAKLAGDRGHVYSFEPFTEAYQRLIGNLQLNHFTNVSCFELALSDDAARLILNVPCNGYDAWGSFASPISGGALSSREVGTVKWDTFAVEHDLMSRVTMMKIDVEGWETKVLAGGSETFKRSDAPVLQVEFMDEAARSAGSSCAELYHALQCFGYQMFTFDAKTRTLLPDCLRDNYSYINLIAVKNLADAHSRISKSLRV